MQPIVSMERLHKRYGSQVALAGLSLQVMQGEVFGLLGANGAGKSTAIECVLGTRKPDSGAVQLLGRNPHKDRRQLFQRVGVQFQETRFQEKIKVYELCRETSVLYKNSADTEQLLQAFGLAEKRNAFVSSLSGGQRQRLCIVLALLPQLDLVFLDELTTGLDAKARRDVWQYLQSLKQKGLTIFLTSHYMDEVEALCDRIGILKQGQLVFLGTPQQAIKQSPFEKLEDAYLWYSGEEVE